MKIRITKQEIESKKTKNGGYTKATLAEWGVSWPPKQGWKAKLIKDGYEVAEKLGL